MGGERELFVRVLRSVRLQHELDALVFLVAKHSVGGKGWKRTPDSPSVYAFDRIGYAVLGTSFPA